MAFHRKPHNSINQDEVFCHGNKEDWDDRELIDEYERKFNLLEAKLNCSIEKKKSVAARQKLKWSIGDICQAQWSEDGVIYDAEIIWIHARKDLCRVRFIHYGNEEEIPLSQLLPPGAIDTGHSNPIDPYSTEAYYDLGTDPRISYPVMPHIPPPPEEITLMSQRDSCLPHSNNVKTNNSNNNFILSSGRPRQMSRVYRYHSASGRPPRSEFVPKGRGAKANSLSSSNESIPFHPPLPFTDVESKGNNENASNSEMESLSEMLKSWYLCGYNTGYFQGVQDASKSATY